jgi:nucleotide-binding universal stress UspA family protein
VPDKVVLAYDMSARSEAVAMQARELADRLGSPVSVIHVVSETELASRRQGLPEEGAYIDVLVTRLREEISDQLLELWGPNPDTDVEIEVVSGDVGDLIVDALSRNDCAYGVIGVKRRSRVGKLVFGSTAQVVLLRSPCPVVAVPVG